MIEGFMTGTNFLVAVKSYLTQRIAAGGTANYRQLLQIFTDSIATNGSYSSPGSPAANVTERFSEWFTLAGYPLVQVNLDLQSKSLVFRQERFLYNKGASPPDTLKSFSWNVPLTYAIKAPGDSSEQVLARQSGVNLITTWFNKNSGEGVYIIFNKEVKGKIIGSFLYSFTDNFSVSLPTGAEWVLVNVQSVGFYKVDYDSRNWNALTHQLQTDHTVRILISLLFLRFLTEQSNSAEFYVWMLFLISIL